MVHSVTRFGSSSIAHPLLPTYLTKPWQPTMAAACGHRSPKVMPPPKVVAESFGMAANTHPSWLLAGRWTSLALTACTTWFHYLWARMAALCTGNGLAASQPTGPRLSGSAGVSPDGLTYLTATGTMLSPYLHDADMYQRNTAALCAGLREDLEFRSKTAHVDLAQLLGVQVRELRHMTSKPATVCVDKEAKLRMRPCKPYFEETWRANLHRFPEGYVDFCLVTADKFRVLGNKDPVTPRPSRENVYTQYRPLVDSFDDVGVPAAKAEPSIMQSLDAKTRWMCHLADRRYLHHGPAIMDVVLRGADVRKLRRNTTLLKKFKIRPELRRDPRTMMIALCEALAAKMNATLRDIVTERSELMRALGKVPLVLPHEKPTAPATSARATDSGHLDRQARVVRQVEAAEVAYFDDVLPYLSLTDHFFCALADAAQLDHGPTIMDVVLRDAPISTWRAHPALLGDYDLAADTQIEDEQLKEQLCIKLSQNMRARAAHVLATSQTPSHQAVGERLMRTALYEAQPTDPMADGRARAAPAAASAAPARAPLAGKTLPLRAASPRV